MNAELAAYSPRLASRPQLVVVTKLDLPEVRERWPGLKATLAAEGVEALSISAATGEGLPELLAHLHQRLRELPPEAVTLEVPVLRPLDVDEDAFTVSRGAAGFVVHGRRIERTAAMTDWENDEAIRRFQRILDALGIKAALRQAGVANGDDVSFGEVVTLEWVE